MVFVRCCSLLRPWTDSVNCRSSASRLLCAYTYTDISCKISLSLSLSHMYITLHGMLLYFVL